MMGCTGGCEPEFALKYIRHTDNLNESYTVYSKSVEDYCHINSDADKDNLPEYFITSAEVPWKERVEMQAAMQKYVDTAISSTVNLPKETTLEEIEELYLYAWEHKLKGITIFRAGCKREGILVTDKDTPATIDNAQVENNKLPWGTVVGVNSDLLGVKKKLTSGCGHFHLQLFFDDNGRPWETFINLGDGGGCERNLEFISKLMSKCLRAGVPVNEVIETAKSIRPCMSYCNRAKSKGDTSKGTCCPSAIGFAIEDALQKIQRLSVEAAEEPIVQIKETAGPRCPECGEPLVFENGCNRCPSCGWSKCE